MTSYQDITRQIGDQWIAALKGAEENLGKVSQNLQEAAAKVELPQLPVSEQVTKFNEAVAGQFPQPSEILEANFELTQRLLVAQKELALKVLAAASDAEQKPAAKKAAK